MAQEAITLSAEAFAWLVTEHKLQVEGPFDGYIYAGKRGVTAWELYKTEHTDAFNWDQVPTSDESGANPAVSASSALCYTCPEGKKALVLGVTNEYVRDVNAANVYATLRHYFGGAAEVGRWPLAAAMTDSVTWECAWSAGAYPQATGTSLTGSLPVKGIEMAAGDIISIYWENDQATDDALNPRVLVKEVDA